MFDRLVAVGGDQTLQLCPHGAVLLLLLRTLLPTAQKRCFLLSNASKCFTNTSTWWEKILGSAGREDWEVSPPLFHGREGKVD